MVKIFFLNRRSTFASRPKKIQNEHNDGDANGYSSSPMCVFPTGWEGIRHKALSTAIVVSSDVHDSLF